MTEYAPLPSNELISSVHTFDFLQSSLKSPNSNVKSMFILSFKFSSKQIINGWEQQDSNVTKIKIEDGTKYLKIAVNLIQSSLDLTNELELIRLRFELTKELFILPDLEKDIGILVILDKQDS
ncbi:hypothetical protein BN7_910 [Wickerhamomyces ciferrii]|uniref:Uncharacterized protein n=1 Tax=Wickerhamomyces ciferrii (strain ATCC 14091 / BCRC 22168 / CBS 111 / JCM 3599 / NBRC 0793 / NRRL Y-1031 F-60-10) TaxID=1206466 RepID=K0KEM4_WICCF|nr:uncharacterized protein BN7_910 [Wickerhamomyces ciferrii]CCH41371.1 hypothetical protein BN7_910 [Wickerhamomyces ciferrii]